MSSTAFECLF